VAVVVNGSLTIPDLLEKLASRHAAAEAEIAHLREEVAKLTGELAAAERERDRWASTRETILALAGEHQPEPAVLTRTTATPAYPQIIEAFARAAGPLRAKDACRALGIDTDPRHVEGMRSKLKKLVARGVLTELEAGVFTFHSG
jgi:hypothetical protein